MTYEEAVAHINEGGRVTSDALPAGSVLKYEHVGWSLTPELRVVFERTGDGFTFTEREQHRTATWHKVEGWLSYGQ